MKKISLFIILFLAPIAMGGVTFSYDIGVRNDTDKEDYIMFISEFLATGLQGKELPSAHHAFFYKMRQGEDVVKRSKNLPHVRCKIDKGYEVIEEDRNHNISIRFSSPNCFNYEHNEDKFVECLDSPNSTLLYFYINDLGDPFKNPQGNVFHSKICMYRTRT